MKQHDKTCMVDKERARRKTEGEDSSWPALLPALLLRWLGRFEDGEAWADSDAWILLTFPWPRCFAHTTGWSWIFFIFIFRGFFCFLIKCHSYMRYTHFTIWSWAECFMLGEGESYIELFYFGKIGASLLGILFLSHLSVESFPSKDGEWILIYGVSEWFMSMGEWVCRGESVGVCLRWVFWRASVGVCESVFESATKSSFNVDSSSTLLVRTLAFKCGRNDDAQICASFGTFPWSTSAQFWYISYKEFVNMSLWL